MKNNKKIQRRKHAPKIRYIIKINKKKTTKNTEKIENAENNKNTKLIRNNKKQRKTAKNAKKNQQITTKPAKIKETIKKINSKQK